jgi:hypothetical protein
VSMETNTAKRPATQNTVEGVLDMVLIDDSAQQGVHPHAGELHADKKPSGSKKRGLVAVHFRPPRGLGARTPRTANIYAPNKSTARQWVHRLVVGCGNEALTEQGGQRRISRGHKINLFRDA